MAEDSPVRDRLDGGLLRLTLARPKANIIDAAMVAALSGAFLAYRGQPGITAVLLDAEGPNFSFGASVEEHLPDQCAAMLASLHALILRMLDFPAPIITVVRGQCLGGGLEVALAGGPIFATPDAKLGQPEMLLGVFAPAASVLLPYRVNQTTAEDLLFSGRTVSGTEAHAMGLVHTAADDPETAALAYIERHLAGKSAAVLACAIAAARGAMLPKVRHRLADVERIYLDRLMQTRDANEGLVAFLGKRKPKWEHH